MRGCDGCWSRPGRSEGRAGSRAGAVVPAEAHLQPPLRIWASGPGARAASHSRSIEREVVEGSQRSRKRRREFDDFAAVFLDTAGGPRSMTSLVSIEEQGKLLVRALRELSLEQQIMLELSMIEGLNGSELAELLDVPRPTVYTRLRRGNERLRTKVAELAASDELATSTMTGINTWAQRIRSELPD